MLKKFLAAIRIMAATTSPVIAAEFYQPYAESHVNFFYNLLFCDDPNLFKSQNGAKNEGLWATLLADTVDKAALRKIAEDENNEGRIRALAYNRLRGAGEKITTKKLLGVIVEVPLQNGLDVLAAFSEGGVRYLNQSGKISIFEGAGNPAEALAKELISASRPVLNQIGPWDKKRLPPPKAGNVRITFLASDGLSFGETSMATMAQDSMGGPVLSKAEQLLLRVVEFGNK